MPLLFELRPCPTGSHHRSADWIDIYNRMYRERILFLGAQVDDQLANQLIAIMLYLDSEDNNKQISMYINSPGGSVPSGLAIFDTMRHIKSDVSTINIGLAASMGSFLLCGGAKGKRLALPHSRTMIHQPAAGGIQGQASDIKVCRCPRRVRWSSLQPTPVFVVTPRALRARAQIMAEQILTIREKCVR